MSYSIQEDVSISGIGKTIVKGLFFSIGTRKRIGLGTNTQTHCIQVNPLVRQKCIKLTFVYHCLSYSISSYFSFPEDCIYQISGFTCLNSS